MPDVDFSDDTETQILPITQTPGGELSDLTPQRRCPSPECPHKDTNSVAADGPYKGLRFCYCAEFSEGQYAKPVEKTMTPQRLREIADLINPTRTYYPTVAQKDVACAELHLHAEQLEHNEWRPIITLPREGNAEVLIITARGRQVVIPTQVLITSIETNTPEHLKLTPTHWQPLPKPPEAK